MTYPRAHLVDAEQGGFYHCISRCVRRGWLCGVDALSGRSFEHRKGWLERRLLELASLFAIELYAYAVMSNHYHLVLRIDPQRARAWSDAEVARRWLALTPPRAGLDAGLARAALLASPERLQALRTRLGSLSWFMRCLNEPIARRANREDGVTGRFWEGRFRSMALLDEAALLACMAYVDLNPIRARAAKRIEQAAHTSIQRRLRAPGAEPALPDLAPLGLTLSSYRALLEWTAVIDHGGVEKPTKAAARALSGLRCAPREWLGRVKSNRWKYRAYGALNALECYARTLGQRWIRGARAAPVPA